MRICIVADTFPKLSETFVLHQVDGLRARGHEVSVLCNERGRAQPPCEVRPRWGRMAPLRPGVDRLPGRLRHRIRRSLDRLDLGFLQRFDVILAHFGYEGARLAVLAGDTGKLPPLVTIYHGHDVATVAHSGAFAIYEGLFRHGALHLAVNDRFRQTLVSAGAPRDRTLTHHMGIDPEGFVFRPRDWSRRPVEILSVCRLTEKKGIAVALDALERLRLIAPELDWRYRIVGDGELAGDLAARAARMHAGDRVAFLGAQPHDRVRQLVAESHLFLLPSVTGSDGDAEGVPVSLMEAMASGAVPVSTRHSGIPELIEDGISGLLAPERDAAALAETLREALAQTGKLAPMADAARKRVEDAFNAPNLIDRLTGRLEEVVRTCGRERAR